MELRAVWNSALYGTSRSMGLRAVRPFYAILLFLSLRRSISTCPRRMEHQSLCSATGMPHSTQICTRCLGAGGFDEKSRLRNDMPGLQRVHERSLSVRNDLAPSYTIPSGSVTRATLVR